MCVGWLVGRSVGWFQHYCSLQPLWASGTGLALPVCNDKTDVFSFAHVRQQAAERTEKSWSELLNTTALMRGFSDCTLQGEGEAQYGGFPQLRRETEFWVGKEARIDRLGSAGRGPRGLCGVPMSP